MAIFGTSVSPMIRSIVSDNTSGPQLNLRDRHELSRLIDAGFAPACDLPEPRRLAWAQAFEGVARARHFAERGLLDVGNGAVAADAVANALRSLMFEIGLCLDRATVTPQRFTNCAGCKSDLRVAITARPNQPGFFQKGFANCSTEPARWLRTRPSTTTDRIDTLEIRFSRLKSMPAT